MVAKQRALRKKKSRQAKRKQPRRQIAWVDYLPSMQVIQQLSWLLLSLLLMLGLVHAYQWMMRVDTLPFKQVTVSGEMQFVDRDGLRRVIAGNVNGGFFSQNLQQLRSVLEAVPWVYRVALRREWPGTLRVHVAEQIPIARWNTDRLINRHGEIFRAGEVVKNNLNLPLLTAENGREIAVLEDYIRYSALLESAGLSLKSVSEDARQDQHLFLESDTELLLGRENRDERLHRFIHIYAKTLASVANKISSLDLRYSNGFSVRWHDALALDQKKVESHV